MVKSRAVGLHRLFAGIAKQVKEELMDEAGVVLSRRKHSKVKSKRQESGIDKDESGKEEDEEGLQKVE